MLLKIHPRANVLSLLAFVFSAFDRAMANCLETWIDDNPLAVDMTKAILEAADCTVAGLTLPASLTTMTNLQLIDLFGAMVAGKIPDEGWENMISLTLL